MAVNMEKIEREAPGLVSLAKKSQFAINKHGLEGEVAKVALCLDYSGSMGGLYSRGTIQKAAERILAVATQFDDDGDIDVFTFDSSARGLGTLSISDYKGGIDRLTKGRRMGSTNYADAIRCVTKSYGYGGKMKRFGKRGGDTSVPVFVVFITDGEPDSRPDAEAAIREASQYPVFFQTVGIGYSFPFLEKLDGLSGRKVDNVGHFATPDIDSLSDVQLLDGLLNEFPSYLTAARAAGVLD